jgi:hypothetical protein
MRGALLEKAVGGNVIPIQSPVIVLSARHRFESGLKKRGFIHEGIHRARFRPRSWRFNRPPHSACNVAKNDLSDRDPVLHIEPTILSFILHGLCVD